MDTIGPYKVLSTLDGARRPMFIVTGKDGAKLLVKTAPLAGLIPEERERFEREAAICSTLDHPNLVRVVDSGQTPEFLYQAMPYLEGSDLSKVFGLGRHFTWAEKLALMEGVSDGLAFAHGRKLVHRDIKPANLFLENTGAVRILDFGMVRMDSSVLTRVGAAVGTLNYMAPEQIRGEPCTPASDVFAAGIVFHQLCSGAHPFAGGRKSLPEILSAILFDAPPAWNAADAPEGLEFVVRRALEKDPAKRWQSAPELRQALSLCRFTLENRPAAAQAAAAAPAFETLTPTPAPVDPNKTVIIRRNTPPPVVAPARPPEPPPAAPPPPPPPPKSAPPQPGARFCPACAYSNAKDAAVCAHCGTPLIAPPIFASEPASSNNRLWMAAAIGALVLLAAVIIGLVAR